MYFQKNINKESGSALVIALVVLTILTAIGITAIDVADLNIFMSANDRDVQTAFFHADSGANIGHEFLEIAIDQRNSTFYRNNANLWKNNQVTAFNSTDFPLQFYIDTPKGTYIRSGRLGSSALEGTSIQMAAGYETTVSAGKHGTKIYYLIRSHREDQRNSRAEVDLGWRHIPY